MAKHLVLVGGGHAHLATLAALADFTARGHRVTLVSTAAGHEYSAMGPGVLAGRYRGDANRIDVAALARRGKGEFLAGRVVGIDAAGRRLMTAAGEVIDYDIASFNIGSEVALPPGDAPAGRLWPVKPIVNWRKVHDLIAGYPRGSERNLLVVGGGPAGVEGAGALATLVKRCRIHGQVTLIAGRQLLPGAPESLALAARRSLVARGVEILERTTVTAFDGAHARLSNGREHYFDLALVATGVKVPTLFADAGLKTGAHCGGLLVNRCLQSVDRPELFGGGDCISFGERPLAKVGVHAVREGEVLRHNLLAALEGKTLRSFHPQQRYLLICNLGDDTALLHRGALVLSGNWVLGLKERIDFRYMNRYARPSGSGPLLQEGSR